jgi:hypothetical protein
MIFAIYNSKVPQSQKSQYIAYTINNHTGPFFAAIIDLTTYISDIIKYDGQVIKSLDQFGSQPTDLVRGANNLSRKEQIKFVQHPIISMETFLQSFDQRKILRYNV